MKVKAYDLDYGINETLTYRIEPSMTMLSLFPTLFYFLLQTVFVSCCLSLSLLSK